MRALALATLVVLAGCSKCGNRAAATSTATPVERLLPKGAVVVAVVPRIEVLGQRLQVLERLKVAGFVSALQGFTTTRELSDALVAQLGIDLRSVEALKAAGIDGTRALGVAAFTSGQAVVVVPVADAARLHTTLEQLSVRRLGAGAGATQTIDGVEVKTFSLQQGQPPQLAYVVTRGFALIASGAGVGALASLAKMGDGDAMSSDEGFASAQRTVTGSDLFLFAPKGSPALSNAPITQGLASFTLGSGELAVAVELVPKPGASWPQALVATAAGAGAGALPDDAFLTARYDGDPAQLAPVANAVLGPAIAQAFAEGKLDPKTSIFEALQPGVRLGLSLADRPPLDRGVPTLDLRSTNPFRYVHLSGIALVKDAATIDPTFERVAAVAPRFGASMRLEKRHDVPAVFTTYSAGEGVHFAHRGAIVLFGSPIARLDALIERSGEAAPAIPGDGQAALRVKVDLLKLAASVRALPDGAWGIGGFAIKATTVRWLDAVDDLKGLSLELGAKDGVVRGKLSLALGLPAGAGDAGP